MAGSSGIHGPRTLTQVRQVSIPVALLRAVQLEAGDDVYFQLTEDGKSILISPSPHVASSPKGLSHDR